ncbi:MAG: hypothetical protein SNG79_04760, partial [Rikenellaceae bacterium]
MTKVTEVAETPKESEATETQEVVEQSSEEAETTYSSSYISIYCCPVNQTAPHNNPSEMYSKHISDGFFILQAP